MNIGILGGTFNPPHIGHFWVAQQALENAKMDKVWIVPNNGSGYYGKHTNVTSEARINMCRLMIKDYANPKIEVSDIEIANSMQYTYQLADYLTDKYPDDKFHLIIGGDWEINQFKKWEHLSGLFNIIHVNRPGTRNGHEQKINFGLSSSILRERVHCGLTVIGMVSPSVEQYIKTNNLYKDV